MLKLASMKKIMHCRHGASDIALKCIEFHLVFSRLIQLHFVKTSVSPQRTDIYSPQHKLSRYVAPCVGIPDSNAPRCLHLDIMLN